MNASEALDARRHRRLHRDSRARAACRDRRRRRPHRAWHWRRDRRGICIRHARLRIEGSRSAPQQQASRRSARSAGRKLCSSVGYRPDAAFHRCDRFRIRRCEAVGLCAGHFAYRSSGPAPTLGARVRGASRDTEGSLSKGWRRNRSFSVPPELPRLGRGLFFTAHSHAQPATSGHSAIVRYAGPLGASSDAISVNEVTRQRIGCDKRRSITVVLRRASVRCGA
jgi:hypothetical protein